MFNQNVWHRGPQNLDPQNPTNRVMFILTFASRRDLMKGDVRQQGLGTYFYQRWNVWGHTFEDLKHAATVMTQPLGALRSLGLWKLPSANWGITWVEHTIRQLANKDDYYHPADLPYFLSFLDSENVPRWLLGFNETSRNDDEYLEWEPFLLQCQLCRSLALHCLGNLRCRFIFVELCRSTPCRPKVSGGANTH